MWYHPENNWGPIIDNLVKFEEDFNSLTKKLVGWGGVDGYLRPDQFLDHLTVIIRTRVNCAKMCKCKSVNDQLVSGKSGLVWYGKIARTFWFLNIYYISYSVWWVLWWRYLCLYIAKSKRTAVFSQENAPKGSHWLRRSGWSVGSVRSSRPVKYSLGSSILFAFGHISVA